MGEKRLRKARNKGCVTVRLRRSNGGLRLVTVRKERNLGTIERYGLGGEDGGHLFRLTGYAHPARSKTMKDNNFEPGHPERGQVLSKTL